MLACTRSDLNIIKFLIENGSNIYIKNKDGWNCFHVAVREGHLEIIEYFLSLDSKLYEVKSNNLRTVFHTAGSYFYFFLLSLLFNLTFEKALHGHYEILKVLADRKCDSFFLLLFE